MEVAAEVLNKRRLIQVNPERCCPLTDSGRRGRGKCRRCHGNELYAIFTEYFSPASTYRIRVSIRDPGPSNSFYFTDHTQPSLISMTDAVSEALIDSQDPGRHTLICVWVFLAIIVKNIHMLVLFHVAQLWVLFWEKGQNCLKTFIRPKQLCRPTVTTVTIFIAYLLLLEILQHLTPSVF